MAGCFCVSGNPTPNTQPIEKAFSEDTSVKEYR